MIWSGAVMAYERRDYDRISKGIKDGDSKAVGNVVMGDDWGCFPYHGDKVRIISVDRKAILPAAEVEVIEGDEKGRKGWMWLDTVSRSKPRLK